MLGILLAVNQWLILSEQTWVNSSDRYRYMALCRIKAVEQLQYQPPGELGKLLGLDRIPEVRCLRKKLSQLSQEDAPPHLHPRRPLVK
jgi:hypothetical protein